jgi:hypothetical protein
MKHLFASAVVLLFLAGTASAETRYALRGLFCNTPEDLQIALALAGPTRTLTMATQMTNQENIVCTLATAIRFEVTHPARKGRELLHGKSVAIYEGTLVGVRIGNVTRPIFPPLNIHFLPLDPVPKIALEDDA